MRIRRILLLVLTGLVLYLWLRPGGGPSVEPGSVVVLELGGEYVESPSPPLVSRLLGQRARPFVSLLSDISKAERDERLDTIVFRIRRLGVGWGKAQELRQAISEASSRGRRTVAFLELESFSANLEYFVASGAQEVYAAPATRAPIPGLAAEYVFLGGLWENLGIEVEVERIGRYKSAAETLAGKEMSEATREMANSLLDSVDEQFVNGIADGRDLTPAQVRAAVDAAPADPQEMLAFGLIDGVKHRDELLDDLLGREADGSGGDDSRLVDADAWARVSPDDVGFDPVARFALVYGSGAVQVGEGNVTPQGDPVLASDTVSRAIDSAVEDDEIDAIVLRVDSPGGSPLASDIVYRATERARARGKPVIASFSDVAASGGYYVAAGADAIVASPTTITGSIGVFVLRPVLAGALDELDIGFESLTRGEHAELQLATRELSPDTRQRLRDDVRSIYDLFLSRVAEGRELAVEAVDDVAQGRVWTGAQAAQVGLVDTLGGLRAAVDEGKRRVGLDPDADVALVVYPPPRSAYEQVLELLQGAHAGSLFGWGRLPVPDAVRRAAPWLRAVSDGGPVALLPFALDIR